MAVISNSVAIRCTQEEAFDYLSDNRNELEWNPGIESIEKITDGPVGLGTQYRAKWKSSPHVVVEIIEYERPQRWAGHNGGPVEVTVRCRLEPVTEGTKLFVDFEAVPHGWFKLIFPLFLTRLRKEERANMTHIRETLERRAARESLG
jgi:carbon monoxide dehydrogenase subunit G